LSAALLKQLLLPCKERLLVLGHNLNLAIQNIFTGRWLSDDVGVEVIGLTGVHVLVKYADFFLVVPSSRSEKRFKIIVKYA
jgi:hypothetical protein